MPKAMQGSGLARPAELQDGLNRHLYHPLARRLAQAVNDTFVTPNMISIAGGVAVILAAIVYSVADSPLAVGIALSLHMLWHVLDGADGDLARLRGTSSPAGEMVDGAADYLSHGILYLMLGYGLHIQIGPLGWAVTASAIVSRIVQASFYETHRRRYQYHAYGTSWLGVAHLHGNRHALTLGAAAYLGLARMLMPRAMAIDRRLRDGGDEKHIMRSAARRYRPLLRWMQPLGANGRTIVLGLSMLAGSPLYFFLYEIILLNILLLPLLIVQGRIDRSILRAVQLADTTREPNDR